MVSFIISSPIENYACMATELFYLVGVWYVQFH